MTEASATVNNRRRQLGLTVEGDPLLDPEGPVYVSGGHVPNFLNTKGERGGQSSLNVTDIVKRGSEILDQARSYLSQKVKEFDEWRNT